MIPDSESIAAPEADAPAHPEDNPDISVADAERARYAPILEELTTFEESLKQHEDAPTGASSYDDEWEIL